MHTMDSTAWAHALGVHESFLERAMQQRLRRLQDTEEELRALFNAFKDAPDDELVLSLRSANRSLTEAVDCMRAAIHGVATR